ncbi:hypothetical protein DPMN_026372 [Dreissena polymorpha]|uniref:Uncharacterized protein n=1 Tax=Dreissena polymorpha TaxID=45954 RepID=A0A9D4RE81_DREPO|nr:hypothetical protein DPMN_026372 [Dreissena polymorpha]
MCINRKAVNLSRATTENVRVTFTNCTRLVGKTSVESSGIKPWIAAIAWIHPYRPELATYPGCR